MSDHNDLWDDFGGKNPDIYDRRQEMKTMADTAREFYKLNQDKNALKGYRNAYKMAELINESEKMGEYKYWEADCLCLLSRYKESLVEIFTSLQINTTSPLFYFRGLIIQLKLARIFPLELKKIQSIIQNCYDFNRQNGLNRESMILINESKLASIMFDGESALRLSIEALAKDENGLNFDVSAYYQIILSSLTDLKQLSSLKEWFVKFQNANTKFSVQKQLHILQYQAEIALLEETPETAYEYAKRHFRICQEVDGDKFDSSRLVIRTGIAAGKLDLLHDYLCNLFQCRNSESKHDQYRVNIIFGEYYAVRFKRDKHIKDLKSAKKCFERAMKIGIDIDQLLECNGRQNEVLLLINELENMC
jgi:hypothetical protein